MQAISATEPFHKAVHGPHWYLLAVGARSQFQGRGLGSALVEIGTSRADAAGVPCYLETGTQSNIDFYAKRGFEIVGQTNFDGHTLTGMGWLVLRASPMPRLLGWLLLVGGLGYVASTLVLVLLPDATGFADAMLIPSTVAELWMITYLLWRGITGHLFLVPRAPALSATERDASAP